MNQVYLNGEFLPAEQAKISPMDRGFLFGDGVYEVIPSYQGKMVGFEPHINRLNNGLKELKIPLSTQLQDWRTLCEKLLSLNGSGNLGIYIQISRGADTKRSHAYPQGISPTVFAFAFEIPAAPVADINNAKTAKVITTTDRRWQRCHIKSTSLLGNVMHYQQGIESDANETLLFDQSDNLTEASSSNVFIVKNSHIVTPPLSNALLPGITRQLILDILKRHSEFRVSEAQISKNDVLNADEVWLSSSSKEIMPVVQVDEKLINNGTPGEIWQQAQELYSTHKFDY